MSVRKFRPYPAYKDSGVEWLGEIPAHWEAIRADGFLRYLKRQVDPRIYATVFHYSIPSIQESGDGIEEPGANIDSAKLLITEEALLVSKLNPRKGTVIIANPRAVPTVCSSEFTLLFSTCLCDLRFAYYLYMSESVRERISAAVRSATRSHQRAEISDIVKAWHGLPPLPEQQAITAFLDRETTKIDALMAKKERLIELLQEKRATLITHAVTKGLDPTVPMKDSGVEWLGLIPAHWDVKRIAMAVDKITNGYVGPTRDILADEGVRYLQSLHIKNGEIIFDKPYYVTEEWSRTHAKSILKMGDILIVQTGDVGQCCAVPKIFEDCNCHALIILRLKKGLGSGFYVSAFLRSDYGRNALLLAQTGALHPHLECGKVREIRIVFPPADEQNQIMAYLDRETAKLDALIAKVREGIEKLKEYRNALISAAVTGKIDVREAV